MSNYLKKCSKCKRLLTNENFTKKRTSKDGLDLWCKDCRKDCRIKYRKNFLLKIKESNKKYYLKNKRKIIQATKEYYFNNKGKRLDSIKKWQEDNKEKRKTYNHKWYIKNKSLVRNRNRKYRKVFPDRYRTYVENRRALREKAIGNYTEKEWEELKSKYGNKCLKCGKRETETMLTPDHIVPLDKNGSNYIDNIQPLCRKCNSEKNVDIIDFRINKEVKKDESRNCF